MTLLMIVLRHVRNISIHSQITIHSCLPALPINRTTSACTSTMSRHLPAASSTTRQSSLLYTVHLYDTPDERTSTLCLPDFPLAPRSRSRRHVKKTWRDLRSVYNICTPTPPLTECEPLLHTYTRDSKTFHSFTVLLTYMQNRYNHTLLTTSPSLSSRLPLP
jgi:hypothetical protein